MPLIHSNGREDYTGRVLADRERNGYDDSDFYAVVWTANGPAEITYDSTCFASSGIRCVIDATPDVRAAYDTWRAREHSVLAALAAAEDTGTRRRGDRVIVARGRKVPVGTIGDVTWIGAGYRAGTYRCGVRDDAGAMHWTDAANLDPLPSSATGIGVALARAGYLALCRERLETAGRHNDGTSAHGDVALRRAGRGLWSRLAADADAAIGAI